MSLEPQYASLNDEDLLHVAADRKDLRPEAALALDTELARRGLTHKQARAKGRDELRMEIKEAMAHRPKRNKSKYFVAQLNLRAFFIGLAGLGLLMFLTLRSHRLRDEWAEPILFAYLGVLMACLAVQTWVRQTLAFWLSLAIGNIPQFIVSHWLAVYHPARSRGKLKGSGFLSMVPGGYSQQRLFGCSKG
jgi:hypothetical protein